jgi:hypothetical protein
MQSANSIKSGPGLVLVFVYGVFAVAAGARATVQLATKFGEAPLAYLLSLLAAIIYAVATAGLARGSVGGRRLALACISVELAGVLLVGAASFVAPEAFPDESVWSGFGNGYGYIPLALPILGLIWLRSRPASTDGPAPSIG